MKTISLSIARLVMLALTAAQLPGATPASAEEVEVQDVFDGGLLLLPAAGLKGIRKGERLEVYRLAADPEKSVYVGRAEVSAVGDTYLLARMTGSKLKQTPRTGDRACFPGAEQPEPQGRKLLGGGAVIDLSRPLERR